jgi:hypothetical protein
LGGREGRSTAGFLNHDKTRSEKSQDRQCPAVFTSGSPILGDLLSVIPFLTVTSHFRHKNKDCTQMQFPIVAALSHVWWLVDIALPTSSLSNISLEMLDLRYSRND